MSKVVAGKDFIEHKVFKAKERETLADKGQAMPGGGYPIRNRSDLQNAIQAYGRAKNKASAMAWIVKRAKELDAVDLLPDSWKSKTAHASSFKQFLKHHGVKGQKWGVRRSRRQLSRSAKSSGRSVKDLSDNELRAVVNRMNMEQQFSRLTTGRSKKSTATRIIATGATLNSAVAFARSPAGQAIRKALERTIDTSASVSSIGR